MDIELKLQESSLKSIENFLLEINYIRIATEMSGRMDDPESQAARVFVGGVNPDTEEQVLIERFSKHGNVKGIRSLQICFHLLGNEFYQ